MSNTDYPIYDLINDIYELTTKQIDYQYDLEIVTDALNRLNKQLENNYSKEVVEVAKERLKDLKEHYLNQNYDGRI